jgi:hypothetical protein
MIVLVHIYLSRSNNTTQNKQAEFSQEFSLYISRLTLSHDIPRTYFIKTNLEIRYNFSLYLSICAPSKRDYTISYIPAEFQ